MSSSQVKNLNFAEFGAKSGAISHSGYTERFPIQIALFWLQTCFSAITIAIAINEIKFGTIFTIFTETAYID